MAVALHPQMQVCVIFCPCVYVAVFCHLALTAQELCMLIPALPADCLKEGLWVISNACQCKDAQVIDVSTGLHHMRRFPRLQDQDSRRPSSLGAAWRRSSRASVSLMPRPRCAGCPVTLDRVGLHMTYPLAYGRCVRWSRWKASTASSRRRLLTTLPPSKMARSGQEPPRSRRSEVGLR